MFERYSERARRAIFFARYEASLFGSTQIETQHLLLGILRESHLIPHAAAAAIRIEIERQFPREGVISTAVDIPLSEESRRALQFGEEAATAAGSQVINCGHLLLGVLRVENSFAAEALRTAGFDHDALTAAMSGEPEPSHSSYPIGALAPVAARIMHLAGSPSHRLHSLDPDERIEIDGTEVLRRVALLGLIERAIAFYASASQPPHQWAEPQARLIPWGVLVNLWRSTNLLIAHRLSAAGEAEQNMLGESERYVSECEHVMKILNP